MQRVAGDAKRVLSFGCSTGEEPQTLSELNFPTAQIIGMDISDEVLTAARSKTAHLPNVTIMQSTPQAVSEHGPFDVIFAMSVLCRWPIAKRMENLSSLYPFSNFEARVSELAESVKPEGFLVVHNGSYSLTQSRLIRFFDLVLPSRTANPGPVTRFAPAGNKLGNVATDCIFQKRITPWDDGPDIPLRIISDTGSALGTIWLSVR